MAWLRTSLRRLRTDKATALGLALLVLVTATLAGIAPRLLEQTADAALRGDLGLVPTSQLGLALGQEDRLSGDLGDVAAIGASHESALPDRVRAIVADHHLSVEGARWTITDGVATPATTRFRFQPGALERVRFDAGVAPTDATTPTTAPVIGSTEEKPILRFEGAISSLAASIIGVKVGDVVPLSVDPVDRLGRQSFGDQAQLLVTGLFTVTDLDDPFWFDDSTAATPITRDISSNLAYIDTVALLAPEAYAAYSTAPGVTAPMRYTWRLTVDADRLDAATVDPLVADLRRVSSTLPTVVPVFGGVSLQSDLLRRIELQQDRWRSAVAILTVLAVGTAFVAIAALALVARMLGTRRRGGMLLARGRGATRRQLAASAIVEALILAVPAAALGAVLAAALVPAGSGSAPATALAAATVGLVAIVVIAGLLLTAVGRSPGGAAVAARDAAPGARRDPRRVAIEAMLVGLAIVGIVLLRSRGLRGEGDDGQLPSADPFIAAVPALVGVAAGILAIRLFRLPMRGLAALAATRRDLGPVLAMRRLTRSGGSGPVLLVLLGTASIAAFASATFAHLDRTSTAVAWYDVGAPFRVDGSTGRLPPTFDPAGLPGVRASAGAFRGDVPLGDGGSRLTLLALDVADYAGVVAGTPAQDAVPTALQGPASGEPYPAIVSTALTTGPDALAIGDTFDLTVDGTRHQFRAVATQDAFPTLPVGGRFAVVSRDVWPPVEGRWTSTTYFLDAPDDALVALRSAVSDAAPGASTVGRAARSASLQASPFAAAVRFGVSLALGAAIAYAALAVAVALALAGAARVVESTHLRLLGLGRGEAVGLAILEHGPIVALAFALGFTLGYGLFLVVRPALGLESVVGSALEVPVTIAVGDLLLTIVSIAVVAGLGIGLGALAQRRSTPASIVRLGIE